MQILRSERYAAGMMTIAAVATPAVGDLFNTHWHSPQPGVLAVDVLLLLGLGWLALTSRRTRDRAESEASSQPRATASAPNRAVPISRYDAPARSASPTRSAWTPRRTRASIG